MQELCIAGAGGVDGAKLPAAMLAGISHQALPAIGAADVSAAVLEPVELPAPAVAELEVGIDTASAPTRVEPARPGAAG